MGIYVCVQVCMGAYRSMYMCVWVYLCLYEYGGQRAAYGELVLLSCVFQGLAWIVRFGGQHLYLLSSLLGLWWPSITSSFHVEARMNPFMQR